MERNTREEPVMNPRSMKGETMDKSFDIQAYMTKGVERVVGDIARATFRNPRESAYMARFALASRAASKRRRKAENAGEHIPAFLIASIRSDLER